MKKGFTLIELLAVIVILAIIAIIAIPLVLHIINDTRGNANVRSIDMYAKAVENAVARYQLNNDTAPTSYEQIKKYVKYNGNRVECDDFRIYSDGTVYLNQCKVDDKYVNYSKGNAIGKGTLAEAILKKYGGASNISEIDKKYKEPEWTEEKDVWLSSSITYEFGTSYELNKNTGSFKLTGTITEATVEECRNGTKQCGEYVLPYSYNLHIIYKITSFVNEEKNDYGLYAYMKGYEKNSYNGFSIGKSVGVYKTEDDFGTSYFYRGNIDNNYVKFGSYKEGITINNKTYTEETPIYWRIVRVNGNGTIRLVYVGTEIVIGGDAKIGFIGKSAYNPAQDEQKYVKYTYFDGEKEVDSTIKSYVDNWYTNNLKNEYSKYLSDGIFCNNFEELDLSEFENPGTDEWGYINVISKTYKGTGYSLKCLNEESKYTINNNIGNGKLSNPIGLITAEEANLNENWFSVSENNEDYDLVFGWTMSPGNVDNYTYAMYGYENKYQVWNHIFDHNGGAYSPGTSFYVGEQPIIGVSPVINLKADVKFKGDGSRKTPYEIIME